MPLSSSEAQDVVRRGLAEGIPEDELYAHIKAEGLADESSPTPQKQAFDEAAASMQHPTKKEMYDELAIGSLAALGGIAGGVGGGALMAAHPMIGGAVGEGIGSAIGQEGGIGLLGGKPSFKRGALSALGTAGIGLGTEGVVATAGRAASKFSGIPKKAFQMVRKMPTMQVAPGEGVLPRLKFPAAEAAWKPEAGMGDYPELQTGQKVVNALEEAKKTLSPGRIGTLQALQNAENRGVKINGVDLQKAIQAARFAKVNSPGEERANAALDDFLKRITNNYGEDVPTSKGVVKMLRNVSPRDADEILRASRSYVRNAMTTENPSETQDVFRRLGGSIRDSFYNQIEKAMPGAKLAKNAAATKQYLDSIENLEQYINEVRPENFARNLGRDLTQYDVKGQSALKALRTFQSQYHPEKPELSVELASKDTTKQGLADLQDQMRDSGEQNNTLEDQARQLGLQRRFNEEEFGGRPSRTEYMIERMGVRPAARFAAVAARPAGRATAAVAAFLQAMKAAKQSP